MTFPRIEKIGMALLAVLVAAIYGQVAGFSFVNYDDVITGNPWMAQGLSLTALEGALGFQQIAVWVPLSMLSQALDVDLFGQWAGGHHLTNVAFHLANALLLFSLFLRLTGDAQRSWLVAALFAVHPANVESVAWVVERKDVLSTFFLLMSLHAYVGYGRAGGHGRLALTLALFVLAALSKSMVVSAPLLMLMFDRWLLGRMTQLDLATLWPLVREKIPFALIGLACGAANTYGHELWGALIPFSEVGLGHRLAIAASNYAGYMATAFWPSGLAVHYPEADVVVLPKVIAGLLAIVAGTGLAFRLERSLPVAVLGWLWFVVALLPVIGLMRPGVLVFNDRLTYLPGIGLFAAIAWMVPWEKWRAAPVLALAAVVALSVASFRQAQVWRDDYALFGHAVEVTRGNALAHVNLAVRLMKDNRPEEARAHAEAALAAAPGDPQALSLLAGMAREKGRQDEAEALYLKAAEAPRYARGAWFGLGTLYLEQGRRADAIAAFESAATALPKADSAVLNNLGAALVQDGRPAEAGERFAQAIAANPGNMAARYNLGRVQERLGDTQAAAATFAALVERAPGHLGGHQRLAVVLTRLGDRDGADRHRRAAERLSERN